MKKIIIFLALIISGAYLINFISAISVNLNSGDILDSTTWGKISNITDKISVSGGDMKINGKIYISGKLCDNTGKCLGDKPIGTQENPGKSCLEILDSGITDDGVYRIKPEGYTGSAFQSLCDMTTDGGGRTIVSNITGGNEKQCIINGTLNGISNLSTYGNIKKSIGTYLGVGTKDLLFKASTLNYIYSINNSSSVSECVKGNVINIISHNGIVKKLGSTITSVPNLDHLGCNYPTRTGWRFGGNEGGSRTTKQVFNNYASRIIINGVHNSLNKFSVRTR